MKFSAMKLSRLAMTLVGALGLASAAPANAATFVFDFGADSGGLNTGATPDVYSLTVGGLTVTVRAFSNIYSTVHYASPTNVTWASSGLGGSGNGSGELNQGGGFILPEDGEGLLLDFGQSVTLTQALFGNFGRNDDVDFEWGIPIAVGETLDALGAAGGVWNGSFTGSQFFFAARDGGILDSDSFRLDGVTVDYTPPAKPTAAVPEPATWAMMLLGFGVVGASMRRRQQPAVRVRFA